MGLAVPPGQSRSVRDPLRCLRHQPALFSSPAAGLESTRKRINLLRRNTPSADESAEVNGLIAFAGALEHINKPAFSKYQRLKRHLQDPSFKWSPSNATDRIVLFSERLETLRWLDKELASDFSLKASQIAILHAQLPDGSRLAAVIPPVVRPSPALIAEVEQVTGAGSVELRS